MNSVFIIEVHADHQQLFTHKEAFSSLKLAQDALVFRYGPVRKICDTHYQGGTTMDYFIKELNIQKQSEDDIE